MRRVAFAFVLVGTACSQEPGTLEETGLYSEFASRTVADGIYEYTPRFQLWSDGARKRRFLQLPEGAKIDTSDPDFWVFPKDTKIWKEFSVEGTRVETRMMHKTGDTPDSWTFTAYVWDDSGAGQPLFGGDVFNARGTEHDVPNQGACMSCHGGMPDRVLGISNIQLAHDGFWMQAQTLNDDDRVTEPVRGVIALPGTPEQQEALGALHANCGACHNSESAKDWDIKLETLLKLDAMRTVEDTSTFKTAVDQDAKAQADWTDKKKIIAKGAPDDSVLYLRMNRREPGQMPPLASEKVDGASVTFVRQFIESLAE